MKRRPTFRGTAWEPLESRALLNGGYGIAAHAPRHVRPAHPAGHYLSTGVVPQGAVSSSYVLAGFGAGTSPVAARRLLTLGASRSLQPAPDPSQFLAALTVTTGYPTNTAPLGFAGGPLNSFQAVGIGSNGSGAIAVYPGTSVPVHPPITVNVGSAPAGISGPYGYGAPLTSGRSIVLPTGPTAATGGAAAAVTTTVATATAVPALTLGAPPSFAPVPPTALPPTAAVMGLFGTATLTPADVTELKQVVDAFAASYTSGADPSKDQAAATALQSGLDDLALGVWSESHVASPASVSQLQQAVDSFAKSYTSGANLAQDKAAWKALQGAVSAFGTALAGGQTPSDGGPVDGWSNLPMPGGLVGGGFELLVTGLVQGPTLSKSEVTTLQTAVDTFAGAYTSGSDASKDQAAADALQASLSDLASSHWAQTVPTPIAVPGSPPLSMTTAGTAAVSITAAPPTPPTAAPIHFTVVRGGNPATPNGLPNGMG
jgi:hypothetical protein